MYDNIIIIFVIGKLSRKSVYKYDLLLSKLIITADVLLVLYRIYAMQVTTTSRQQKYRS